MLLYYYDYYGCFLLLWQHSFFRSCSGTNSCLSLCGTEFILFRACKEGFYVLDSRESWLLQRFQQEIWNLLVWTQPFHFFLSLFAIPLFFALFKRKKKICVCCSERTPRFYSVEFYGTDLYNFKSSYFSIHAKYSSITTKKHVTKIRIKKMTASHLYFLNIVPLLYYVLQSPKRKKNPLK